MNNDNNKLSDIYEVLNEVADLQKAKLGAAASHIKDIGSKISSTFSGDKQKLIDLKSGGSGKEKYESRVITNLINGFIKTAEAEIRKTNEFLVNNNYNREDHPDVHEHLSSLYQIIAAAKKKITILTQPQPKQPVQPQKPAATPPAVKPVAAPAATPATTPPAVKPVVRPPVKRKKPSVTPQPPAKRP